MTHISREEVEARIFDILRGELSTTNGGAIEGERNAARQIAAALASRPAPSLFTDCQGNNPEPRDPAPASAGWQWVPKEPTEAMLEAALDISGQRIAPFTAERESGVPVECDISDEDARNINEDFKAGHSDVYGAMLSAAPASPLGQEWRDALAKIRTVVAEDSSKGTRRSEPEDREWNGRCVGKCIAPKIRDAIAAAEAQTSAQAPEGSK